MRQRFAVQAGYLSGEIHAGQLNKDRTEFTDKDAVTGMVVHAVADWADRNHDGHAWVRLADGRRLDIDVTPADEAEFPND